MENRIKDCQLDLLADRMSAHAYTANQMRLIFAAFAYVLIDGIRRLALKNTALANAVPSAIRLKLLKIGARVASTPCGASSSPCPTPVPAKPCSSRLTPLWRPHSPNPSATTEKGQDVPPGETSLIPKIYEANPFPNPATRPCPLWTNRQHNLDTPPLRPAQ